MTMGLMIAEHLFVFLLSCKHGCRALTVGVNFGNGAVTMQFD
jgi:hypothetical protein